MTPGLRKLCEDCATDRRGCNIACSRFFQLLIDKSRPNQVVKRDSQFLQIKEPNNYVALGYSMIPIVETPDHFLEKGIPYVLVLDMKRGSKTSSDFPFKTVGYLPPRAMYPIKSEQHPLKPKLQSKIVISPSRNPSLSKRHLETQKSPMETITTKNTFYFDLDPGLFETTSTTTPEPTSPTTKYVWRKEFIPDEVDLFPPFKSGPGLKPDLGIPPDRDSNGGINPHTPGSGRKYPKEPVTEEPDKEGSYPREKVPGGSGFHPHGSVPGGGGFNPHGSVPGGGSFNPHGSAPGGGGFNPHGSVPGGGGFNPHGSVPGGGSFNPHGSVPGGGGFHPHGSVPGGGGFHPPGTAPGGSGFNPQGSGPGQGNSFPLIGMRGENGEYYIYQTVPGQPGTYKFLGIIPRSTPGGDGFVPDQGRHIPPVSKSPHDGDYEYSAYDYETDFYSYG